MRKITALVLTLVLVLSLAVPNAAAVVTKSNDNVILVNSNTPQETEARSEVLMAGDVDGDGKVSVTDAMLTLRYAVRKIGDDALNTEIADANRDGSVSAADAMLILRFAVKKISELPPITRTVTFESNGGTAVAQLTVMAGKPMEEPEAPFREGYFFGAWYTDAELETLYDYTQPVTENITLYAKWNPMGEAITGGASSVDVYFVSDLVIDRENGVANVTVSAPENCAVLVRFIEEDVYFSQEYPENKYYMEEDYLYASHVVRGGTDMEQISAEITGWLPEYFVAEAVLIDAYGENLCDPYTSIEDTRRNKEFQGKTIHDFGENDIVLNFDKAEDNNFGVLAEDVKLIQLQKLVIDEETNVHYLTGAEETVGVGDKLLLNDGTNQALIRVKSVRDNEGVLEIVPAQADDKEYGFYLADFYKFLKVDMDYDGGVESKMAPVDGTQEQVTMGIVIDKTDVDTSASTTLAINPISFETTHFRATGKISGTLSANLVIKWDVVLFGEDYFRFDLTYSTNLGARISVGAKFGTENNKALQDMLKNKTEERELKLGKVRIPFGVTGLDAFADIKTNIEWRINAGLVFTGNIKTTHGFKYNTKDGRQKVDQKNSNWSINCEGDVELSFGPKPSVGVEFLNGVISAELECFFGGKAEGTAEVPVFQGGDSKHACYLCVGGSVKGVFSVDAKLKYKVTEKIKGTPIDWNIVTWERTFFDFYVSLHNDAHSMFGGKPKAGTGSCPNEYFKTEFLVYDQNDELCDATVTVTLKSTGETVATVASGGNTYLSDENYVVTASIGDESVERSFTVSGQAQTIEMTLDTGDGIIAGLIMNAKTYEGIPNATISVYKGDVLVDRTVSNGDGSYEMLLAAGEYSYEIFAVDFITVTGSITIEDKETKYMETTLMAEEDEDDLMGGIFGTIRDAQTGQPLSGVQVSIYTGINNIGSGDAVVNISLTTDEYGQYNYRMWTVCDVVFGLPAGNYTVVLSAEKYITTSFNVVVVAGQDMEFNGSIAPVTAENEYRVVLTWGAYPEDLDSHFLARFDYGISHVYYSRMYDMGAMLDTDDTSSYGPETIYVNGFESLPYGFTYSVHDYTNEENGGSAALSASGATVKLYRGGTLIATYHVPAGRIGTVWNVFYISPEGTVVPINTMDNQLVIY